jgi:hypothetical protein
MPPLREEHVPAAPSDVSRSWVVFCFFTRDTRRMKVQATIVISYRADSFGDVPHPLPSGERARLTDR